MRGDGEGLYSCELGSEVVGVFGGEEGGFEGYG